MGARGEGRGDGSEGRGTRGWERGAWEEVRGGGWGAGGEGPCARAGRNLIIGQALMLTHSSLGSTLFKNAAGYGTVYRCVLRDALAVAVAEASASGPDSRLARARFHATLTCDNGANARTFP